MNTTATLKITTLFLGQFQHTTVNAKAILKRMTSYRYMVKTEIQTIKTTSQSSNSTSCRIQTYTTLVHTNQMTGNVKNYFGQTNSDDSELPHKLPVCFPAAKQPRPRFQQSTDKNYSAEFE